MNLLLKRKNKELTIIQAAFIFIWLTILSPLSVTDTYYSVYLLCGVVGLFCLWDNYSLGAGFTRAQGWALGTVSCLFSLAVALANYSLFTPLSVLENLFDMACCLVGGVCTAYPVLLWMLNRFPLAADPSPRQHPGRVFLLVFAVIAAVDLTYLFTTAYPGVLTLDSMASVREFSRDAYSNVNPFWFTVTVGFFYRIGFLLFGEPNAAMAFYVFWQILFLAACAAYAVVTLYQAGVPRPVLVAAFVVYAFLPYQIVYSVTVWKDVLFGAAALLIVTSLYRILRGVGRSSALNYGISLLGMLGFCLWRTNGWYAFLATTVVLFFCLRKRCKKLVGLMGAVVVICWVMINPLLSWLNVSGTDFVEAFSIPLQQIARVVYEGHSITVEEEELLSEALDLDAVRTDYIPHLADPIKWGAFRRDNREFVEENFGQYVRLWLKLGMRYPSVYLKAWIEQTRGYWNAGYQFWVYTEGVVENEFGIAHTSELQTAADGFRTYFAALERNMFFQPFYSIGLYVWMLIGCFFLNMLKKRITEAALTIPILVLIVGLWLGTPVYAEFRYAYPMFLAMPVLLAVTCYRREEETNDLERREKCDEAQAAKEP